MKKNTHPTLNKTTIILQNGSTIQQKWNFFKKILKTDSDFLNNKLWKNEKK
jgi:hypothetical protein